MPRTIRIPVNAETRHDATVAVQRQLRRDGIAGKVTSAEFADFATGQLPDEQVAITVTQGQHGPTPESRRRTVIVTVERTA